MSQITDTLPGDAPGAMRSLPDRPVSVPLEPVGAPMGDAPTENGLTPAGLQPLSVLAWRRALVVTLNLVTLALLGWGVASVFGTGGWSVTDIVIMICFLIGAPWTVMGVWNAFLGLWLLHGVRDGVARVAPHMTAADTDAPVTGRIAVSMTVRNEAPERAYARLLEVRRQLDATGQGLRFDVFILSDTSEPETAAAEELLFQRMRADLGGVRAHYRRRAQNVGFKAGNVRDFLMREGRDYDFFLPLDSDSLMDGPTILRMARIMEAHPRIGILQSLAVGTPATSLFARIFQFGMRHGMRSFTMGAAWWQGDCGPFWGHNALIRTAPFRRWCRLPILPGKPPLGGHILSHDQVEAVLMRRAGYEVRVMPTEGGSWEDNPPTLMDFTRRDLRWCQGNMQYWPLLGLRGLRPTSRFQLFAAIMMYLAAPAWMLMTIAAAAKIFEGDLANVNVALGIAMFFIMFAVSLMPKLAGMVDIMLQKGGVARYGGTGRFLSSAVVETIFSMMLAPVVALRVTLFLIGLCFGKKMAWSGQNRDAYALSLGDAVRGLWPQTLFGVSLAAFILTSASPGTIWWALPMLTGMVFAIPFALVTASPWLGRVAQRWRLCGVPEEWTRPSALMAVSEPERVIGAPEPEPSPKAA